MEERRSALVNAGSFSYLREKESGMFLIEILGYVVMFVIVLSVAGCLIAAFVVFGLSSVAFLGGAIGALGYWIGHFFKWVSHLFGGR